MVEFLDNQQKIFKKLMKEFDDDLETIFKFIKNQINNLIEELNNTLEENLENVVKKILKEFEKIGISINPLNLTNIAKAVTPFFFYSKIILGVFVLKPFVFFINVFNTIKNLFKKNEKIFNDYLKDLKEEINNTMKYYFSKYNNKMKEYESLTNDFIIKIIKLIAASNIQADDNYNEAKENYLKIYDDYKKMNIIFDIKKP